MNRLSPALAAIALAGATAPLHAQDPRLVNRLYDDTQVVLVEGRLNVQATIKFAEDEHIENVAIGDSTAWQVTPNKRANVLFVKPLAPAAMTNMTVITDRRTYLFDLVASSQAQPLYVLDFRYEEQPEGQISVAPSATEKATEIEMAAAKDPYAVVNPAALNFSWRVRGDKKLLPERIYDDGTATFLVWSTGRPLPAILIKDHQGTEGPVNFAVRGETIVIDGVPREIVLRSGGDLASLVNQGPVPEINERAARALARANSTEVSQ